MHVKSFISLDYSGNTWKITPTTFGRHVLAEQDRMRATMTADTAMLLETLEQQAAGASSLAWPLVRPILASLIRYWQDSGWPVEGVSLTPIAGSLRHEHVPLFGATIRTLVTGGYLDQGQLRSTLVDDDTGQAVSFPAEVTFTDKARRSSTMAGRRT